MVDKSPEQHENLPLRDTWGQQYQTPDGRNKVEARRTLYDFVPEDEEKINFDNLVIEVAEKNLYHEKSPVFVDVGCSFPYLLLKLQSTFEDGRFVGVEPNTQQFNGLAYWEPKPNDEVLELFGSEDVETGLTAMYRQAGREKWPNIELYENDSSVLPLPNGSADVVSFMFSMYHVPAEAQGPSLLEAKRILKKVQQREGTGVSRERVAGTFILATSGNENKSTMRENESLVAHALTEILGTPVRPPQPLNSGFTTEDARRVLTPMFDYVYEYSRDSQMIINTPERYEALLVAYRTLRDQYILPDGTYPDEAMFEEALQQVVPYSEDITDIIQQSLFVCSDVPQLVDKNYVRIISI